MRNYGLLWLIIIGLLTACGSTSTDDESALPTRFIPPEALEATPTRETSFSAASAPEGTIISRAPTLPPTFTPTPLPTEIPTSPPSPTPQPQSGTIYFIYNGDSIIRLQDDGTFQELIVTFGVGVPIRELSISPNGELLAFIAPGNGSAYEIWVSSLDGSYLQKISCLGFADVRHLAWHPDSQQVAFAAAQSVGSPLSLYVTSWVNSNQCPQGNNQRQILEVNSTQIGGISYSADGNTLYFSNDSLYALDLNSNTLSAPLTITRGIGADFGLSVRTATPNVIYYLQDITIDPNVVQEGLLYGIDGITGTRVFEYSSPIYWYDWGITHLLASAKDAVYHVNPDTLVGETLVFSTGTLPYAVYSPDETHAAYVKLDINGIPQIYIQTIGREDARQLTNITEGTITDLIWIAYNRS